MIKGNVYKYNIGSKEMELCVSQEDIDDIMCSALEGGITYWCECLRIKNKIDGARFANEQISRGGILELKVVEPFDDEETEWYLLDEKKFIKGLLEFLKRPYYEEYEEYLYEKANKIYVDPCYIDAESADAIIQYGLFGEIVYG